MYTSYQRDLFQVLFGIFDVILDEHYDKAIELYTKAINLNEAESVYYGNRSLAYLKTELYGYALQDANKAIDLDKNYVKGYYRRAAANMALGKFKLALRDYELVRFETYCI